MEKTEMANTTHETEAKKLVKLIPEWKDRKLAESEARAIRYFLLWNGWATEEVEAVPASDVVEARLLMAIGCSSR
jgi:hypothetical protein